MTSEKSSTHRTAGRRCARALHQLRLCVGLSNTDFVLETTSDPTLAVPADVRMPAWLFLRPYAAVPDTAVVSSSIVEDSMRSRAIEMCTGHATNVCVEMVLRSL